MGIYIEYIDYLKKWYVSGHYGYGFYDTEEEARAVYEKMKRKFKEDSVNWGR